MRKRTRKEKILLVNSHKIKTRIFELQLSQEEIAKRMSLDQTTLNAKINNKRRIYIDEVKMLCDILDVSADFLLGKKEF